ncbi:MAG: tetratricopeptide repeat protein [Azospirillum sp.]|nr:tetratricopeptide repeat protein [Azospirillum sp.]
MRARRFLAAGVAAAGMVLAAYSAFAAAVPVRVLDGGRFGRILFDWPTHAGFEAEVSGTELIIQFDTPIETALDPVVAGLSGYLSGARLGADKRSVVFTLKRPMTQTSFRAGNVIAITLAPTDGAAAAGPAPSPQAAAPQAAAPSPPPPAQSAATARPAATAPAARDAAQSPAPAPAAAPRAEAVRVRGGEHSNYSRVVFDWPKRVGYEIERAGDTVTVHFDRPAEANLGRVRPGSLHNLKAVTASAAARGLDVTLSVAANAGVKDFRSGNSVVLDITDPQVGAQQSTPPPQAPAPQPSTQPAAAPASGPSPAAPQRPAGAGPAPAAAASAPAATAPTTTLPVPPPPPAMAPQTLLPPVAAAPATVPAEPMVPPTGVAAAVAPDAGSASPGLEFDAGGPAAAAVFSRGGYLFAVFDRPLPIAAGTMTGRPSPLIGRIEPVPAQDGSAFRVSVSPLLQPAVERRGTVWRISFEPRSHPRPVELSVEAQPDFPIAPRLLVHAQDASTVVQFIDPAIGDPLLVVPLPATPQAVTMPWRYPQLRFVPALQGVAVAVRADGVVAQPVREGVEVRVPGGVLMSPAAETAARPEAVAVAPPRAGTTAPAPAANRRLFDPTTWQHGSLADFTEQRQALQTAVIDAVPTDRSKARLDLARFYFAHGFAPEAHALLEMIGKEENDLQGWPEFRALRGASAVAADHPEDGLKDLSGAGLDTNPEAALWRGLAEAAQRAWPAAAADFKKGESVLAQYPEPLLRRMTLAAAEAYLGTGQPLEAARLIDAWAGPPVAMAPQDGEGGGGHPAAEAHGAAPAAPEAHAAEPHVAAGAHAAGDPHGGEAAAPPGEAAGQAHGDQPAVLFLRGEINHQTGHPEEAIALWQKAFEGKDRYYRARAGLALTNLLLAEGKITPESAVERLSGLRFAWRGDDLELDIIQRDGEVQWLAGQYAAGLTTLREAASYFPEGPRPAAITKKMTDQFAALFKDGARTLPPIKALELYDQFRELTPVGAEGDAIIRQLAERLVEIDLLGRAAELLQHQVEYRLSGADKAEVGTRLASIRLLDDKPELALAALEASNVPGIAGDLADERKLLRVRALAKLKRGDEAMALLANDDSRPANLLRVDIAWRDQKWQTAAAALDRAIGPLPADGKLDAETAQLILNRAVALALAGDGKGLDTVRAEFGAAMARSAVADAFRVVTRPEEAASAMDLRSIKTRVAEVDVFQNFLKNYRSRREAARPTPTPLVN